MMEAEGLGKAKTVRTTGTKMPTKVSFALLVKNPTADVIVDRAVVSTDGGPDRTFRGGNLQKKKFTFRLRADVEYSLFVFSTETISMADVAMDASEEATAEEATGSACAASAEAHDPPPAKKESIRAGGRITVTTTNTTPTTISIPLESDDVLEE